MLTHSQLRRNEPCLFFFLFLGYQSRISLSDCGKSGYFFFTCMVQIKVTHWNPMGGSDRVKKKEKEITGKIYPHGGYRGGHIS